MAEEESPKPESEESRIEAEREADKWVKVYTVSLVPLGILAAFWKIFNPPFEVLILFSSLYLVISLVLAYPLVRKGDQENETKTPS